MKIELEAVGDGIVVNPGCKAARSNQFIAVEADALGHRPQFFRCFAGVPAASATDVEAKLTCARIQAALESAHHRSSDAGRMPVHAHHATQRLKPERIAQARK